MGCFVELFFSGFFLTALEGEWVMIHLRSLLGNRSIFTALWIPGEEGAEAGVGATPWVEWGPGSPHISPVKIQSPQQVKYNQNEICAWSHCKGATAQSWAPCRDQAMPMAKGRRIFPSPSFTLLVMQLILYCVQALGPFNCELNCFLLLPQHGHVSLSQLSWILCPTFFPLTLTVFDKAFQAAMGWSKGGGADCRAPTAGLGRKLQTWLSFQFTLFSQREAGWISWEGTLVQPPAHGRAGAEILSGCSGLYPI